MGRFLWILFFLLIVALLYAVLGTDDVSSRWMAYINAHALEHDSTKGDLWEAEKKYEVARYCHSLGNFAKAQTIYRGILEKFPETATAQMAEYYIGECYEKSLNFMEARTRYLNCAENYPEFKESEWAYKGKKRYNEIIAGRQ